MTTRLLLLGAGRSASALITYLLRHAPAENWFLTVADAQPAHLAAGLAAHSEYVRVVPLDVRAPEALGALVAQADLVISMLPAGLHPLVAAVCLAHRCHLATASYVSAEVQALHHEAAGAGLTFLMECGLDPGLDHMSAMQVLDDLRAQGAHLTGFRSDCGGLVAPESEGNNPWRYKFSWSPRNVVLAGQPGPARYLEDGREQFIPYEELFARAEVVAVPGHGHFEAYANRDALTYQQAYGLADVRTMRRGTLRRPGFCGAWQALVNLGLTNDSGPTKYLATTPWRDVLKDSFNLPVPLTDDVAAYTAQELRLDPHGPEMTRLAWLGVFSERPVGLAHASPAQLLEHLLAEKWALGPHDRDQIVMQHQFDYELAGQARRRTATLVVTSADGGPTAMAQTVGLPLGMAVRRLLRGEVRARGVVIPTVPELYEPILAELAADYGIAFVEHDAAV
jgi:saccharopine dehydrogenase-like NADP-dependent oxidoreductase